MSASDELKSKFVALTRATEERAQFFLEASNFDFENAVQAFYNTQASEEEDNQEEDSDDDIDDDFDDDEEDSDIAMGLKDQGNREQPSRYAKNNQRYSNSNQKRTRLSSSGGYSNSNLNFATLNDLNQENNGKDGVNDGSNDYFAGGSERSGQMIQGPAGEGNDGSEAVGNMMNEIVNMSKRYSEQYRKDLESSQPNHDTESKGRVANQFRGSGYTLGDEKSSSSSSSSNDNNNNDNNNPSSSSSKVDNASSNKKEEEILEKCELTFWRNGFQVNDGEFRSLEEPENRTFLTDVMRGVVPLELRRKLKANNQVDIAIIDKRNVDYDRKKHLVPKPFQGHGNMLGSPTPKIIDNDSGEKMNISQPGTPINNNNTHSSPTQLEVDFDLPITNIQVRMGDGSKLILKANHTHTIGDIRKLVQASCPNGPEFTLRTVFPPKEITDDSATLEDAKLLNAAIIQKFNP